MMNFKLWLENTDAPVTIQNILQDCINLLRMKDADAVMGMRAKKMFAEKVNELSRYVNGGTAQPEVEKRIIMDLSEALWKSNRMESLKPLLKKMHIYWKRRDEENNPVSDDNSQQVKLLNVVKLALKNDPYGLTIIKNIENDPLNRKIWDAALGMIAKKGYDTTILKKRVAMFLFDANKTSR